MNRFFRFSANALLIGTATLASCKKDAGAATGLVGSWKLTNRQCYCPYSAVPNETVTFTPTEFSLYANGQFLRSGTYTPARAPWCGGTIPVPVLRFEYSGVKIASFNVVATLNGNTLVLDHGGCLDAPVDTYERLP